MEETETLNACFPCTACCVWTEIPELSKSRGVPCRYLDTDGCRVYSRRPQVCREFFCFPADFQGKIEHP